MPHYTVVSNRHRCPYLIEGDTLPAAIEANFGRIAEDAVLGNAAGYRLSAARAEYRPGIFGGKGGVALTLTHTGLPLAHRPADSATHVTEVWIFATPDDLPEPHDFELRQRIG